MTIDIDARMRAAGGSLRQASAGLSPELPPRPRVRPMTVAAVVLVVAALTAGMVVLGQDHDRDGVSTDEIPTLPRLVPGAFPGRLPPATAVDLPLVDSPLDLGTASVTVYGDPAADDPFGATDLAVLVSDVDALAPEPADGSDPAPVTVRGRQGTAGDDTRLGAWVEWEEAPGQRILMASHGLGRDQLLAVAEGVTSEGEGAALGTVPAGVPGPLEPIGTVPDFLVSPFSLGVAPMDRASAVGYLVGSETEEYDQGLFVTTSSGDASDLAVIRWLSRADDPVEVRGHAGWIGAADQDGVTERTLIWEESPGTIVVVQAVGLTEDELLSVAAGLRPAGDDEWQALLDAVGGSPEDLGSAPADEEADAGFVALQGDYSTGIWSVHTDVGSEVCAMLLPDDESADLVDSCAGRDDLVATLDDGAGNPVVIYGELPEGAVSVGTPAPAGADSVGRSDDGRAIYALVVEGAVPPSVVFYDAGGRPVTTVEVGR